MLKRIATQWSLLIKEAGIMTLLGVPVCLLLAIAAYQYSFRGSVDELRKSNAQRLEFFAISLESALEKYEYLPFMLTLQRDVTQLLAKPTDTKKTAALTEELNIYLQLLQEQSRAAAIYVLDDSGTAVATSNWREPGSFIGHNYVFRPYFRDAMAGRQGRFYAVGTTTGEPGYFLSSPIFEGKRPVGVAVVKVSLNELEAAWKRGGEQLALADSNGVAFLTSIPGWKYRTLRPLSTDVQNELLRTKQYGGSPLEAASGTPIAPGSDGQRLPLHIAKGDRQRAAPAQDTLVQSYAIGRLNWQLLLFSDLAPAHQLASNAAIATASASAFMLILALYLRLRTSRRRELAAARAELQRAHHELEQRISVRTAELVTANAQLQSKVSELKGAQELLRETQNDLVQAGKLAVLGQMAAGVTHELNQPLTAMRTLSDNAITLMRMNQLDEARENLAAIAQLTDRMGRIVGQLKAFSRKSNERLEPLAVGGALDNALTLIDSRARHQGVEIRRLGDATDAVVLGDDVRLEQVFVNLLRNAIDAMGASAKPVLTLTTERADGGKQVSVTVTDNGPGLDDEALKHLFEPFYTTKMGNQGLGLGLTISLVIVRAMGGELSAHNEPGGGASFRVLLPTHLEPSYA
jgi:two-component system, NtrC family, C4-dicarboxylate transport sensor histidine kinase DctB